MGKVILLGAGPGDVGLLTLKGKAYIEKADCIVYDRLIGSDILSFAREDCCMVYAGKENHHHVMTQDEINEELYQKALEYNLVVRVKGGDPYVFGRGGEEALYLRERGIECEVIPGVSSFIAALTDAGIPITHRAVARGFQVMTAHSKGDKPLDIDYRELLNPEKTCVFMMGLSHLREIADSLMAAGRNPATPAAVISDGTRNNQRKCIGTLADIADKVAEEKLPSPAVIVVGDVIRLNEELAFFENRPLFGRTYFVPYLEGIRFSFAGGLTHTGESELAAMLKEAGAQVIAKKVGTIQAVDCDVTMDADWLIFTSKNGVYACFDALNRHGRDLRSLGCAKIAAVGQKTAATLMQFGIRADLVAEKETGADLGKALLASADSAKAVWFCAEKTGTSLEEALAGKWQLEKRVCYRNEAAQCSLSDKEIEAIAACDGGIYTSASAAQRAFAAAGKLPKVSFSIGPECSRMLRELGAETIVEAESRSYDGLVALVSR